MQRNHAAGSLFWPPHGPVTLLAHVSSAERTVSAAALLLFNRTRGVTDLFAEGSLDGALKGFTAPLRYRTTTPNGPLAGANSLYQLS